VHPGVKPNLLRFLKKRGAFGRALYDETVRAFEYVESTISDRKIDCDYSLAGHIQLAAKRSHVSMLRELNRVCNDELGEPSRFIPAEDLRAESGSTGYHGGLVMERSGTLDPAKYYTGMLNSARQSGAEFHEHTHVTRIEHHGSAGLLVYTSRGTIVAKDVLVATDGYTDDALRGLQRRIVPIGSYAIATEPLAEDLARAVSPNGRSQMDTKNFLLAWRVLPDRTLLFGGRTSFRPTTVQIAREHLYQSMLDVLPQLAGVSIVSAWGGMVGFTFDRLPHAGRHRGVTYAMGYCGSGVALAPYIGFRTGAWLAGGKPPLFAQLAFRTAPLYRGRPWFLRSVGWYYQLKDRVP